MGALEAGPLIRRLREHFDGVRRSELERHLKRFREEDRPLAERLTRDLVQKLLHTPTREIRRLGHRPDSNLDRLAWVQRLFGLDAPQGNGGPPERDGRGSS